MELQKDIDELMNELAEVKLQLSESNSIIEAIKEGTIDALVLTIDGNPNIYSIESADYTYRILIEKFGEGALSISEDGLILYCNEYFSKLIGIKTNKIIGTYFISYVDSVGEFHELKSALKDGPSKGEIVLNINGKKLPVYTSLTNLSPSVPAIGIIVSDMTEKRKHEEALTQIQRKLELKVNELNQANANLEQFIHVVSQDIKEPLRKIVSYSSHLRNTKFNVFERNELNHLNVITTAANRLNSLVEDLVQYAFSNQIEFSRVDLNLILKDVIDDLELSIEESGASILVTDLPAISGSKVQIRHLFSNLLSNSIKYRKKDVELKISILCEVTDCIDFHFPNKKFYKISVKDNGIGMDETQIQRIFNLFKSVNLPNEYSGNGIGLAICKRIMDDHAGQLGVESSQNGGSIFNIYFPYKKAGKDED